MSPIEPARGENTPFWHGPIRGTFPCLKRVGAVFWRFTAATPVARPGRRPYPAPRHSLRMADTDDRRRDPRRVPRRRGAARRAFHPLVGVAFGALPAMRPRADEPGARRAAGDGAGRVPASCDPSLDPGGRLPGDGRRHRGARNGPRARRRGDVPRTARRRVRTAPRFPPRSGHACADDGRRGHHRPVVAAASLGDRANGTAVLGVPFFPLLRLDVPTYAPDALPPELAAIPATKPGSRAA